MTHDATPGTELEPYRAPELAPSEPDQRLALLADIGSIEPYRKRFSVAYAAIGAIAVTAVAGFVGVALFYHRTTPPSWSVFRPTGDRLSQAAAIANYVAPRYRLDTGQQIVGVYLRTLSVQNQPVALIAIVRQPPKGQPQVVDSLDPTATLTYDLCGTGNNCAIGTGTPSPDRQRLLRREALELALYSLRYVKQTQSVLVFLPPLPGKQPTSAMLFRKRDFDSQLGSPLSRTLAPVAPNPTGLAHSPERAEVEALTRSRLYAWSFVSTGSGPVLVLGITQ